MEGVFGGELIMAKNTQARRKFCTSLRAPSASEGAVFDLPTCWEPLLAASTFVEPVTGGWGFAECDRVHFTPPFNLRGILAQSPNHKQQTF